MLSKGHSPNGAYLVVTNVFNAFSPFFFDPSQLYSVSVQQRVAIEGGQTAVVRVSRPIANASTFRGDVTLRFKGPAMPDFGYTPANDRLLVTMLANQTSKDIVLTAPALPGFQGWRRLYVEVDPLQQLGAADHRPAAVSRVEVFVTDPALPLPQPAVDTDQDALTDDYESANGLDPQRANDPYADPDRDGLNHLEEQAAGSRANNADSDGDGAGDFLEYLSDWRSATNQALATPSLDNSTPVRLKVTSCYKCHATALQVGDYSLMSMPEVRRYTTEEVARLAKGRSYPVQVFAEFDPFSPTNHQLYGVEILAVTNPPGFLLEDPEGILGPQRVANSNLIAKIVWLHIPRLELGVDASRDNVISFLPGTNDQTSVSRPYTFWLNNDRDSGSDDQAEDLEPAAGALDNADTVIANQRDLEDFTRLHLKLEAVSMSQLQQGTLSLRLEWRSVTGTPSLRIYRASETSGTNRYLFDTAIAASQLAGGFGSALGTVASGGSLVLPASVWTGASGSNVFRPFLFEGVSAGHGQLWAVLVNASGAVAESTPVFLRLDGVTNLFEHFTGGDTNTMDWNMIPGNYLRTYDSGSPATDATRDYILLVHGWRMQPWERRAFAATAFKRLYWQGYRGGFGLFSWPTDWTGTSYWDMISQANRQNYDRSERRAWQSAMALRRLLLNLNRQYPGSVRLLSHSMGGVVSSEALRIHGSRANSTPAIHTYVAAQPASVAHAYDAVNPEVVRNGLIIRSGMIVPEVYGAFPRTNGPQRYYMGMANAVGRTAQGVARTWNYHNFVDYALNTTQAWPLNQALKPDFGWDYAGVWWRGALFGTRLDLSTDAYEIFAHIATARSKALGCSEDPTHLVRGEIGNAFDLRANFSFQANTYEHSAEFNSTTMRRYPFWQQVLGTMSLTNTVPAP